MVSLGKLHPFSTILINRTKPYKLYQSKIITGIHNTKCLGLELDKNVSWKNIVQKIIPKLSSTCYLVRRMYHVANQPLFKMIDFAYFHVVMKYSIMLWEDLVERKTILQQQKKNN
jgi:hypothetical protein